MVDVKPSKGSNRKQMMNVRYNKTKDIRTIIWKGKVLDLLA